MICPHCAKPVAILESLLAGYVRVHCPEHGETVAIGRASVVSPLRSVPPPPPDGTVEAGMEGSELAAGVWTPLEIIAVDRAIETVSRRMDTFTADDIWLELGEGFPVTKGLASRLNVARRRGVIMSTDRVTFSQRTGIHGHGQRLAVWASVPEPERRAMAGDR